MMLKDGFGRIINYMRVSVTDSCNLRCGYCSPDGASGTGAALTSSEIVLVCAQAAALGIDRFRLTGGEPLLRTDLPALIAELKRTEGIRQVALTTNGVLLKPRLKGLLDAGLDGVNISLDTLDRGRYRAITGVDALDRVLEGIHAATGCLPVRINCVIQRGVNEDAPTHLVELARKLPVDVRFIELMPIGIAKRLEGVSNDEILAMIEARFGPTTPDDAPVGSGPAVYRRIAGFQGRIGLISAVHGKFCDRCNRLRLTANGYLKPCLCYQDAIPLLPILRSRAPDTDERIRTAIRRAVAFKPRSHCFEAVADVTEHRRMSQIGG